MPGNEEALTMSQLWRPLLLLVLLGFALVGVACEDDDDTSRRTGLPQVDAIIDAVESGEPSDVIALVRFTSIPCVPPDAEGFPCRPGQEEGSPVSVVPVSICEEGPLMGREELTRGYLRAELVDPSLYAVYKGASRIRAAGPVRHGLLQTTPGDQARSGRGH